MQIIYIISKAEYIEGRLSAGLDNEHYSSTDEAKARIRRLYEDQKEYIESSIESFGDDVDSDDFDCWINDDETSCGSKDHNGDELIFELVTINIK
jgi:hypothetical protein